MGERPMRLARERAVEAGGESKGECILVCPVFERRTRCAHDRCGLV